MVADFLCRKTLLSSALSQVRAQISTHSDGNFGLSMTSCIGQQAFARSGLGAPASTAAVHAEFEAQRQAVLELRRVLEERDEELAAARETNRRLMNQLNRSGA
jgi:hypothetical protein